MCIEMKRCSFFQETFLVFTTLIAFDIFVAVSFHIFRLINVSKVDALFLASFL